MTAFLRIMNMDLQGNTFYANLQIGTNQGVDGKPIGWFEIVGDNGGADGGTWEWVRNQYNLVCLRLNSNKFKTVIGELKADDWGKGIMPPPHQPYFRQSSKGDFNYIFPGYGKGLYCTWHTVKILG